MNEARYSVSASIAETESRAISLFLMNVPNVPEDRYRCRVPLLKIQPICENLNERLIV